MKTKQTVAIIGGSGKMGSAIARNISKGNYRILLHATDQNKLPDLVADLKNNNPSADVEATGNFFEACWEAEIIIVAVPYEAEKLVAYNIRKVANQKIVISISNPLIAFDEQPALFTSAAEELQVLLPNSKVIKAFNMVTAGSFSRAALHDQKPDCFIAGNDEDALEVVRDLVTTAGYQPVIAGDLYMSRTMERMQFLLTELATYTNDKEIID